MGSFVTEYSCDVQVRLTGIARPARDTSVERSVDGRALLVTAGTGLGDQVTEYSYAGWEPVGSSQRGRDGSGVSMLVDAGGTPLVETGADGVQRWLVTSLLGDITATANASGAVTQLADADAYGQATFVTGEWASMHSWTGELSALNADAMVLYHQRVYQPGTATWNQIDSLNTPNRHNYVGANPVSFVDEYGFRRASNCPGGGMSADGWFCVGDTKANNHRHGNRCGCSS